MTHFDRRQFAAAAAGALAWGIVPAARAQARPALAKIIVPFSAGTGVDNAARLIAGELRGQLADAVVVETRTGAGGRIAVQALKQSPADGSTLLIGPDGIQSLYPHVVKQLGYDAWNDLAPVSTLYPSETCLFVGPGVPATVKSLRDYLAWAKADPRNATFATGGAGTPVHVLVSALGRSAGVELVPVHYRGAPLAFPDLMGGQVPAMGTPLSMAATQLGTGKIRILATSGEKRSALFPDIPTFAELGFPQLVNAGTFCAYVPGKTPAAMQERLSVMLRTALASPDVVAFFKKNYLEPAGSTPQEALRLVKRDYENNARLVKLIGYEPE